MGSCESKTAWGDTFDSLLSCLPHRTESIFFVVAQLTHYLIIESIPKCSKYQRAQTPGSSGLIVSTALSLVLRPALLLPITERKVGTIFRKLWPNKKWHTEETFSSQLLFFLLCFRMPPLSLPFLPSSHVHGTEMRFPPCNIRPDASVRVYVLGAVHPNQMPPLR